jgi:hypothetical protein
VTIAKKNTGFFCLHSEMQEVTKKKTLLFWVVNIKKRTIVSLKNIQNIEKNNTKKPTSFIKKKPIYAG